jgi:hypothetical protein
MAKISKKTIKVVVALISSAAGIVAAILNFIGDKSTTVTVDVNVATADKVEEIEKRIMALQNNIADFESKAKAQPVGSVSKDSLLTKIAESRKEIRELQARVDSRGTDVAHDANISIPTNDKRWSDNKVETKVVTLPSKVSNNTNIEKSETTIEATTPIVTPTAHSQQIPIDKGALQEQMEVTKEAIQAVPNPSTLVDESERKRIRNSESDFFKEIRAKGLGQ